ncbi:hypothetical protein [Saccharomonospora cyanea]|uniref:Uncharacterized protein n=1 Tax=Saccharomonospora cyanea NA-134 TaxID=882082 RepID=H5XRC5_9PSEU|nr:hypothetical protein [Saccharomonospora cyanea]EHR63407.1 hypothetical protein SaccyDRAFT_4599 [Saccharomonospora cyanea NA-134]
MGTVEDSARFRSDDCPLCEGAGVLSWEQPQHGVLRTVELPCPSGCGEYWKHPSAEQDRVVESLGEVPVRPEGNVAAANRIGADFIRAALERWGFDSGDRDHSKE